MASHLLVNIGSGKDHFNFKPLTELNQCWFVSLRNAVQWNLNQNENIFCKEIYLKILSAKWCPFCSGLNVLQCNSVNIIAADLPHDDVMTWERFSMLLALCEGNPMLPGGFPLQKARNAAFVVFFDVSQQTFEETDELPVIKRCHILNFDFHLQYYFRLLTAPSHYWQCWLTA